MVCNLFSRWLCGKRIGLSDGSQHCLGEAIDAHSRASVHRQFADPAVFDTWAER